MSSKSLQERARDFSKDANSYFYSLKGANIGSLFGLSREQGLASVAQQLEIWENELNCLIEKEASLIKFDSERQHAEFKAYMVQHKIDVLLFSDEWRTDKDNVVVVD